LLPEIQLLYLHWIPKLKQMHKLFLITAITIFSLSCNEQTKNKKIKLDPKMEQIILHSAKSYFTPLKKVDLDKLTPKRKKMIELGKRLFYDKKLSNKQNVNCASCHDMEKYGTDNLPISPGDNNQFGTRNTPTVLNAHLQYAQFWDTHARTVEEQAAGPIFGDFEMNMPDTATLLNRLQNDDYYSKAFEELFPKSDTAITIQTITFAIGAFERTLVTPAPIDDYLNGDLNAISTKAKLGIKAFVDNGCIPCHSTSTVGGQMAQKFALYGYYWDYTDSKYIDKGKFLATQDPSDKFVFKVPQLRNVEKTYPYFHDGSVKSLREATIIMGKAETNITLKDEDVDNILEFFKTLTGKIPEHAFENN